MRVASGLVVLTVAGCSLGCGSTPTGPSSATVRTFRLTGVVTDREANSPLGGATVVILDGPNLGRSATTSTDGAFVLTDLRESGFTVKVTRDAYNEYTEGITLTADVARAIVLTRTKLDVSGEWAGSLTFTLDGTSYTRSTTAQMTLADLRLTVTAPSANGYRSTLDGRLSAPYPGASFAGSLELDTTQRFSPACAVSAPAATSPAA